MDLKKLRQKDHLVPLNFLVRILQKKKKKAILQKA